MRFWLPSLIVIFWYSSNPRWHTAEKFIFAPALAVSLAFMARDLLRYLAANRNAGPADFEGAWPPHWPAHTYQQWFTVFLHQHGFRVSQAAAVDNDRLSFRVQKDRYHATLLILRPTIAPLDSDLDLLNATRTAAHSDHACLVIEDARDLPPAWKSMDTTTSYLRYEDLPQLNEALGIAA